MDYEDVQNSEQVIIALLSCEKEVDVNLLDTYGRKAVETSSKFVNSWGLLLKVGKFSAKDVSEHVTRLLDLADNFRMKVDPSLPKFDCT